MTTTTAPPILLISTYKQQFNKCLEYDTRFHIYGEDFIFYDYQKPLKFPEEWKKSFDIVIADPPFLSEECLCNTAVSIKYLAQDKIILCTGNYCNPRIKQITCNK
jgi:16S rRNA G966 N2-methylase RsmD